MVVVYANDFKLMMVVALVALPLIFLVKRAKTRRNVAAGGAANQPCEAAKRFARPA
jgi:hypothetical protein